MFCQHQSGHGSTEGRNLMSAALWATDIGRSFRGVAAFQLGLLPLCCKQRLLPALEVYPGIQDASQEAAGWLKFRSHFLLLVFHGICIHLHLNVAPFQTCSLTSNMQQLVQRGWLGGATRSWEQRAPLCRVSVFVKDSKELLGPLYLWSCRGRKYLRGKAQAMLHAIFEKTLVLKFLVSKTIT